MPSRPRAMAPVVAPDHAAAGRGAPGSTRPRSRRAGRQHRRRTRPAGRRRRFRPAPGEARRAAPGLRGRGTLACRARPRRAGFDASTGSLDGDVRVLVLELGANDGLRGLSVAAMRRNLADDHRARAGHGHSPSSFAAWKRRPISDRPIPDEFREAFRSLAREERRGLRPVRARRRRRPARDEPARWDPSECGRRAPRRRHDVARTRSDRVAAS